MDAAKRTRLEAGIQIGTASDFLGLTAEENALVEIKLALSADLRQQRQTQSLSQGELAQRLKSSQSRVAKIESGGHGVSFDLLIRALLAVGATREELSKSVE